MTNVRPAHNSYNRLWATALHRAYPEQAARFRPSGAANCGAQITGRLAGIETDNPNYHTIWPAQMGLAGQEIALKAFPHLGFEVLDVIREVEGDIPGELDAVVKVLKKNIFSLPELDKMLCDVKVRSLYAYNIVWGRSNDLMEFAPDVGMQMCIYGVQRQLEQCLILLLPHDGSAARNDWSKKRNNDSPYIRAFLFDINPDIYKIALIRQEEVKMYGLDVAPEFDPFDKDDATFPCGYCNIMNWCKDRIHHGKQGEFQMTPVPSSGLPVRELYIP
jgi:hypothetical protein